MNLLPQPSPCEEHMFHELDSAGQPYRPPLSQKKPRQRPPKEEPLESGIKSYDLQRFMWAAQASPIHTGAK